MQFFSKVNVLSPYREAYLDKSHETPEVLVVSMLFLAAITLFFFSIIHLFYGDYQIAATQLTLSLIYIVCLVNPQGKIPIIFKENIVMIGVGAVLLMLLVVGGIANTGVYWTPIFPFIVIAMKGIHRGLFWLSAFVFCGLIIQIFKLYGWISTPYSFEQVFYLLLVLLVFSVVAGFFELVRVQHQINLKRKNEKLEQVRNALNETLSLLENEIAAQTFELKETNKSLRQEIEQHKATNETLLLTEQKFYQAQKMDAMGTLVGGIAHDFSNILSGITANLFLIQREVKGQAVAQDKLDEVERLVFHASEMTKQLLTFARKDKIEKNLFDMNSFMKEAMKLAAISLSSRIKLEKVLSDSPLSMVGSTTQLQQVLMNLLNNARDAVSLVETPVVKVCLVHFADALPLRKQHPELHGDWLYLSVSDNGYGIAPENLPHIFEPFFTTKATGKGTGLGLAMCFGAVQSHGGLIEVDSIVGKGTTFHIYLPLDQQRVISVGEQNVNNNWSSRGESILIVDDDPCLRHANRDVLESFDFQVLEAENGLEAIKLYAQQTDKIDLVIMDITMPEMGGVQAAQHILAMNKDAKIFFISGYDKDGTTNQLQLDELFKVKHIKRLNKPFTIDQLCNMINQELAEASS